MLTIFLCHTGVKQACVGSAGIGHQHEQGFTTYGAVTGLQGGRQDAVLDATTTTTSNLPNNVPSSVSGTRVPLANGVAQGKVSERSERGRKKEEEPVDKEKGVGRGIAPDLQDYDQFRKNMVFFRFTFLFAKSELPLLNPVILHLSLSLSLYIYIYIYIYILYICLFLPLS